MLLSSKTNARWVSALLTGLLVSTPACAVITNVVGQSNRRPLPNPPDNVEVLPGATSDVVLVMWSDPPGDGEDGFAIQGRRVGDTGWDLLLTVRGRTFWTNVPVCSLGDWEFRVSAIQISSGGATRYSAWKQAGSSADLLCLPTPRVVSVSLLPPVRHGLWAWQPSLIPMTVLAYWDGDNENVAGLRLDYRSIDTEWQWQELLEDAWNGDVILVGNLPGPSGSAPHSGNADTELPCGVEYDFRLRTVGHVADRDFLSKPVFFTMTLGCANRRSTANFTPANRSEEPIRIFVRGGW